MQMVLKDGQWEQMRKFRRSTLWSEEKNGKPVGGWEICRRGEAGARWSTAILARSCDRLRYFRYVVLREVPCLTGSAGGPATGAGSCWQPEQIANVIACG